MVFRVKPIVIENEAEIIQSLTAPLPSIKVGDVFSSLESNCKVRVKAIKYLFADLKENDFLEYTQFSF